MCVCVTESACARHSPVGGQHKQAHDATQRDAPAEIPLAVAVEDAAGGGRAVDGLDRVQVLLPLGALL